MTRSKSPNHCHSYIMGESNLDEVDECKLLYITFSKDLSFDSHIDNLSRKVSKLSGFIIRWLNMLNMTSYALLNLYKALILPHIIYCAYVWAPYQQNHLARLEKVQRKVTLVLFSLISKCWGSAFLLRKTSWLGIITAWGYFQNSKTGSGFQDFEWFGSCLFWFLSST